MKVIVNDDNTLTVQEHRLVIVNDDNTLIVQVHRLVIVNDDNKVCGVISLSDILNYLVLRPGGETTISSELFLLRSLLKSTGCD